VVNASTNRINGLSYDANGNQANGGSSAYDIDNRLLTWDGTEQYRYDASNKRVFRRWTNGIGQLQETYSMYGVNGKVTAELAAVYDPAAGVQPGMVLTPTATYQYVGIRKVGWNEAMEDRLGTKPAGSGRPYGENVSQYATHQKDATGLHYADQRHYQSSWGRFTTPDPYVPSALPGDPGSWNRYAYVVGDPVNLNDPSGQVYCWVDSFVWSTDGDYVSVNCHANDGTILASGARYNLPIGPTLNHDALNRVTGSVLAEAQRDFKGADPNDWDLIPAALKRALRALNDNPECLELYGDADTRSGRWDPRTVLNSMFGEEHNNEYGTVDFEYEGYGAAYTSPIGRRFFNPFNLNLIQADRANISIHRNWWNGYGEDQNASTILHELGHVYNFSRGSGGFAISNLTEGRDPAVFDKLIRKKCGLP
jgi:RHS repeat-associated protein